MLSYLLAQARPELAYHHADPAGFVPGKVASACACDTGDVRVQPHFD